MFFQWLSDQATQGDEESQYGLARQMAVPVRRNDKICKTCEKPFSPKLFRHHCRNCEESFCARHSAQRRVILWRGHNLPVRVCEDCCWQLDLQKRSAASNWARSRCQDFLCGQLRPYCPDLVDRQIDKAIRVMDMSLHLIANTVSLSLPYKILINTLGILKLYGVSGMAGVLLRQDFLEAVETLKKISGMDKMFKVNLHELTACVYYKLAYDRGLRGVDPDGERRLHDAETAAMPGCGMPDATELLRDSLEEAIRIAPLALKAAYCDTEVEMQRLAAAQGWVCILAKPISALEQPAFGLFGTPGPSSERKRVVLVIRGTGSVQDVVTDLRSDPLPFPPSQQEVQEVLANGFNAFAPGTSSASASSWERLGEEENGPYACRGMGRAALWLLGEMWHPLRQLHEAGYSVTVTGHSLGAGVACCLMALLKDLMPAATAVVFACPSCMDAQTADSLKDRILSVILHDDIVCRITPSSIRLLMKELVEFKRDMFDECVMDDWQDVVQRARGLWTPRWRSPSMSTEAEAEADEGEEGEEEEEEYCRVPLGAGDETASSEEEAVLQAAVEAEEEGVLVEEAALLELWLPGCLLHLYSYRGQYRPAYASRSLATLRRMEVQGHIFRNHLGDSYFDALLEARAVLAAAVSPPAWTPTNAVDGCEVCKSRFSWHSTFRGLASELRERHHCRQCGRLVCAPCSSQRRAIPRLGLIFPARICDVCHFKGDYAI